MEEKQVHAGIDVAAESLEVCALGKNVFQREYKNDASGHKQIVKKLRSLKVTHVCLEATGCYSLDIALALEAEGFDVMVANPRATRHFAQALMQRSKTDPLDARCLAEFCARMPFQRWERPQKETLELRAIARRIAGLKDLLVQEKNRLHAVSISHTGSVNVTADIKENIVQLETRVSNLQKAALVIIAQNDTLKQRYNLLLSVSGIGEISAISLLAELSMLPADMDVRQWVAHAGLDPRHISSGSSVNGKVKISKAGNARIRKALYLPVLTAVRCVPEIKKRMQHLKIREKNPLTGLQSVVAIMRKLLHAIYGMFKTNTPFNVAKVFPTTA
jgi:transposase